VKERDVTTRQTNAATRTSYTKNQDISRELSQYRRLSEYVLRPAKANLSPPIGFFMYLPKESALRVQTHLRSVEHMQSSCPPTIDVVFEFWVEGVNGPLSGPEGGMTWHGRTGMRMMRIALPTC
jgi:hypothetical protein